MSNETESVRARVVLACLVIIITIIIGSAVML